MYPRIPKTTVASSNKSVSTSIVVMRGHPLSGKTTRRAHWRTPIYRICLALSILAVPKGAAFYLLFALSNVFWAWVPK